MITADFFIQYPTLTTEDRISITRRFNFEVKKEARQQLIASSKIEPKFTPNTHAELILFIVSTELNIPVSQIKSKVKKRPLADARKIYCYIVREQKEEMISQIEAGLLIGKNHSNVSVQGREAETLKRTNKEFANKLQQCMEAYTNRNPQTSKS